MKENYHDLLQQKTCAEIPKIVLEKMHQYKVISASNGRLTLDADKEDLDAPCLYSWWVLKNSRLYEKLENLEFAKNLLSKTIPCTIEGKEYCALYFGKSKNGWNRIVNRHLGGDINKSTLRRTLFAISKNLLHEQSVNEKYINNLFVDTYFTCLLLHKEETEYLVCIESLCIALGSYPLNIEGNPAITQDWRVPLEEARKKIK